MLIYFFGDRTGGERFFQDLETAKSDPLPNLGLLRVMHACLSLGLEAVNRASDGELNPRSLETIRRDVFELIRRAEPKPIEYVSERRGARSIGLAGRPFQIPVLIVAAIALAILFGGYYFLWSDLSGRAEALAAKIAKVQPDVEITVSLPPRPRPPTAQIERIRAPLAYEILDGALDVDELANRIFIRINSRVIFPPGGANASDGFKATAKKIAGALEKEPGSIRVDGYTDSDPIRTLAFPSNYELSEARAKSVAAMLEGELSHPERVEASGKGEANPVAPNDVEANKAKNWRVEISIPRAD